jgi:hypothetical protein
LTSLWCASRYSLVGGALALSKRSAGTEGYKNYADN